MQSNIFVRSHLAKFLIFIAFLYTAIRAYLLSITHDEAVTYLIYALGSFPEIFTYSLSHKSNNHLLNTILIKIFLKIFGVSEFVVRIPALLGHALYLAGIYKLLKLFLKKYRLLLGISILIFHPFLLDFFSCARGYSLALGFLIFSLYYLFKRIKEPGSNDIKYAALSLTMLTLSMLSAPFLSVYFSILAIFILLKAFFPVLLSLGILIAVYARGFFELLRAEEFYYGGVTGFWNDTVTSLIKSSLYDKGYFGLGIIFFIKALIIILIFASLAILSFKSVTRKKFGFIDRYLFWIWTILVISSLGAVLQHKFFNIRYVIERTAIYFIPIFLIFMLILWEALAPIKKMPFKAAMYFIMFIFLGHFITSLNFTHYHSWKYDASTKQMMQHIIDINKDKDLKPGSVSMSVDWIFEQGINFYIEKNNLTWLRYAQREDFNAGADYYYFSDKGLIEKHDLKLIRCFDISGTYLATR